ncbi:LysR substrate-binding domain-containing protein [Pseudochrobactrum sp. MP213Fo]|uniref:LysR substrate-binding domain-containing protein n=1 Tax=Pseudochrobactrum sp. MP213Fo TaxID=3022250 RepID=UPI003BA3A38A
MRLTHRQLEIFQSLMHTLNVTETAEHLGSSQPTISRELKDLEAILGFALFHRDNRRLKPTQQAAALNVIVQRSFVSIEEIARTARAIRGDNLQRVSIACLPAYAHALIPQATKLFLHDHPEALVKIHSLEESALTRDLLGKFFDVGLVEGKINLNASATLEAYTGDLLCIMPADHPLAEYDMLDIEQFAGHNFIYYSDEDYYRRQVDQLFNSAGINRKLTIEATTASSIGSLVAAGIGISMINPLSALAYEGKNLLIRPIRHSIPYYVNIWQPEDIRRGALGAQFVQAITIAVDNIVARLKARGLCA